MNKYIEDIKKLLSDFHPVNEKTIHTKDELYCIDFYENPLNPHLMSYCFDNILGFNVHYRIFEKVNYEIEFDYKGTFGMVAHHKLSYRFYIEKGFHLEVISLLKEIKPLLQNAFLEMAIESLDKNDFTMENEYLFYHDKLNFYQKKIETLNKQISIVSEKVEGQWDIVSHKGFQSGTPRCQDYLKNKKSELRYSIETFIDVFYSLIEHVLTLLYPFSKDFDLSKSYKDLIHNPRWTWDKKFRAVFGNSEIEEYIKSLIEIKEIYRNRNSHGMFSRELKVYVGIEKFGSYPLYIGKQFLKGFIEENPFYLSYMKYLEIKEIFNHFFDLLDSEYSIPMAYVQSGLPIDVDVTSLMNGVYTKEDAEKKAEYIWYQLDNQTNMDW